MPTPDADLVTYLAANIGSLTAGTNLFKGPPRNEGTGVPDLVAFCLSTGGPAPDPFIYGSSNLDWWEHAVQVRVRSAPGAFEAGQTLARAVRDAAHRASIAGYIDVYVLGSDPSFMGLDKKGHSEWSISVAMESEE